MPTGPARRRVPGSACCRAAGSTSSTRRRSDIEAADIAHGLARVARWNGQTHGDHAFSVAQHSLLVAHIFGLTQPSATPPERLATLLHDAPEYVIGDMISPFKAVLDGAYRSVETRLLAAIHIRFGLPPKLPETLRERIKRADQIAAYWEAVRLAAFSEAEAARFFGRPGRMPFDALGEFLEPWPARDAESRYLQSLNAVIGAEPEGMP
jgi:5'-deoxynucleotidase YfbR-like HD superfamily hydrolase